MGELSVHYSISTIAHGQFTSTATVPLLLWSASDGKLTLHKDGTLEVQYPSNGIVEFWRRADGTCGGRSRYDDGQYESANGQAEQRPVKLVLRHFGPGSLLGSSGDLGWHWGLAVGDECYEVQGSMVVLGPKGVVAASSPFASNTAPTHLSKYDALLALPQTTRKSDREIEEFTRQWVRTHPTYNLFGPNCQTFAEDLFTFLCGQKLPFSMSASRLGSFGRGAGPESHPATEWLKPAMRPR